MSEPIKTKKRTFRKIKCKSCGGSPSPLEFNYHSTCFKCRLCSQENLCGTCSNWTSEQWKLFTLWQDGTTMSPAQLNVSQASWTVISDGNTADENIQRQTVFPSAINVTSHSGMSENMFVSAYNRPITPLRSIAATLPVIRRAICIAPTITLIRGHISHKILANLSLFIGLRICDLFTWESSDISPRPTHQITQSSIFPGLQSGTELTGTRLLRCVPGLRRVAVLTPHTALWSFCFFFIDLQWFRWGIFWAGQLLHIPSR